MRTLLRLVDRAWWVVLLALAILCMMSCTTTQYVPMETVRTDSVRVVDIKRDSIFVTDSLIIREKADTVYVTRWRTEFREVLRMDTLQVLRVDSVNTIVEVEKKLSRWQKTQMDVGAGVMYAVPILIAVGLYILYRKLKK